MAAAVGIGELDRLISLYEPENVIDASGRLTRSYSDHSEVFAKLEPVHNVGLEDAGYLDRVTVKATIYKMSSLDTTWRATLPGELFGDYEIVAIDPISRISPFCILTLVSEKPEYIVQ